jgi:hypothetical protein
LMPRCGLQLLDIAREFCEPVEQITGRKIRFLSGLHTEVEGLSVEALISHPLFDGPFASTAPRPERDARERSSIFGARRSRAASRADTFVYPAA